MRNLIKTGILIFLFSSLFSCISNEKLIYLQNLEGGPKISEDVLIYYEIPEYRLQYNDIIDVNVQTVDDLLKNGFNTTGENSAGMRMQMGQGGGDVYYMTGYTVDRNGNIRLPIVGDVYVRDKTIDEARSEIESRLKEFVVSELYVKVKLGGIRYSALGEFRRPGKFVVLQDRMTIFEAIANAGDLNTIAKRDEVMLIRQYPDGTKIHRINLNDRQIIASPFYFIQPNDQLYVEPMKVREVGSGENAAQSLLLFTSILTTGLLLVNLFTK
jgi:polysaccharide biosynthesis/export protein